MDALRGCEHAAIGLHCWHGYDRSSPMANRLANAGFRRVYDLGGFGFLRPDGKAIDGYGFPISPPSARIAGEEDAAHPEQSDRLQEGAAPRCAHVQAPTAEDALSTAQNHG